MSTRQDTKIHQKHTQAQRRTMEWRNHNLQPDRTQIGHRTGGESLRIVPLVGRTELRIELLEETQLRV